MIWIIWLKKTGRNGGNRGTRLGGRNHSAIGNAFRLSDFIFGRVDLKVNLIRRLVNLDLWNGKVV